MSNPGRIHCPIIGMRVGADRSGTAYKKLSLVSLQCPTKTQSSG